MPTISVINHLPGFDFRGKLNAITGGAFAVDSACISSAQFSNYYGWLVRGVERHLCIRILVDGFQEHRCLLPASKPSKQADLIINSARAF